MSKYLVWRPEYDQEPEGGRLIEADDPHNAVCKWADLDDTESAAYKIVGGDNATVKVRSEDAPDKVYEMIVSGESVPYYVARLRIPRPDKV